MRSYNLQPRLGDSCLANSHNLSQQALYDCELQWRRRRVEHRMCEEKNLFLGRRCTDETAASS